MKAAKDLRLVTYGEVLWDCLPDGLFLGGAPLNVAYHAARLGASVAPASRVGRDFLGDQAVDRVRNAGLDTRLLTRHPTLLTGASIATLDESRNAQYEIVRPVAWDEIEVDGDGEQFARDADIFVYGSLAARSASNRKWLLDFLDTQSGLKLCDVNLRSPYDDIELAMELARKATVVKLNEEELYRVLGLKEVDSDIGELAIRGMENLDCEMLCVTLGGDGALLVHEGEVIRVESQEVEVADTIGAGDSFTAAFSVSLAEGRAPRECLERATRLGAYVASRNGAQPDYRVKDVFS